MKIAFLSDAVYPYNKGGKEKRLFEISTRLAKRGHDVHIYCMKWWKGPKVIIENNVTLHGISSLYPLYTKEGKRSIGQALRFSFHVIPQLWKEDFDVLDVDHMPYFPIFPAWLLCKIKRKKIIVTWYEYWGKYWFAYLGLKGIFGYVVEYLSAKLSKSVVAVSEITKEKLIKIGCKEVRLVPCGVDIDQIQNAARKGNIGLLFVGRLIKEKNVELLIDTIKDKFSLGIIGTGPEEKQLREKARKYPNIKFLGSLPRIEDVYGYMKSAKLFVFPSKREGFGIVVLEALACGTPVVVLDYSGNASTSLVPKEFVATEENLLEKIKLAIGKKIHFDAEKYDWENITKQVEEVYQK